MVLSAVQLISPSGSQKKHAFCGLRKALLAGSLHTLQNVLLCCLFDSISEQIYYFIFIWAHQYLIMLCLPSPRTSVARAIPSQVRCPLTLFLRYQHHMFTKDHVSG